MLLAFGFGLACIFTPCVFPMIPITMSYFLNRQSGGKRDSVIQAIVFCLGIIVLFSGLGLAATALLGPFGVVQLGSNPWVNGFISALFIAFGLSLLGAFEITIPSAILTRLNAVVGEGRIRRHAPDGAHVFTRLFRLRRALCRDPARGLGEQRRLTAADRDGKLRRGLSLPFFLLALFPSYLKRLPRSGGWMARIKVVMGFVILAFSLKYLSSLDQVLRWIC